MEEARRSNDYAARLLGSLQLMKNDDQLTDLNIMIDDSQTVYSVHKCVMVAASKYFSTLVQSDQLNDSHCLIRGVEEKYLRSLLDFIYTGELQLNADSCFTLHSAAHQLGIDEAVTLCEQYITDHSITEEPMLRQEKENASSDHTDDNVEHLEAPLEIAEFPELPDPTNIDEVKSEETFKDNDCGSGGDSAEDPNPEFLLATKIKEEKCPDLNPVKRSTRSRTSTKLTSDPDWLLDSTPKRKRKQLGKGLEADTEKSCNTTDEDDTSSDGQHNRNTSSRKRRKVAQTDGGKGKSSLSDVRRLMEIHNQGSARPKSKKKFKFKRFGKLMGTAWKDDSIIVKDLPPFKCKRCQYRFFHASALCLHSLHKHGMSYPSAKTAVLVNRARITLASKRSIIIRRGGIRCRMCSTRFSVRSRAICHFHHKHLRSTVKCLRCDARLYASCKNRSHKCVKTTNIRLNVPGVIFCRHCPRQFRHTAVIERHYEEYHPEESYHVDMVADVGFQCRHCKRTFVRRQPYVVHLCGHGLNDKEIDLEFSDPSRVVLRSTVYCQPDDHETEPYKCPDCDQRFARAHRLDIHMMNKHNKRVTKPAKRVRQTRLVKCVEEGCNKVFSRMPDLREHVAACHSNVMYICPFGACKYTSNIKHKFDQHVQNRHESDEERTCTICQKQYDKKYRLKVHMVHKHGLQDPTVRVFRCEQPDCDYVAFTRYSLEVHKRKHIEGKQYSCDHCGKKFKCERSVAGHIKNTHLNIRPYICDICGATYVQECELRRHLLRHGDTKEFQCEMCDYGTNEKGNFQSHMFSKHKRFQDTSDMKNVWTCHICGYKCNVKHRIQEHMDSHTKTKRHVCQVCGDAFVARYSLVYHIRKVHEGVTYECKHCTFKAPTKTKLNFHMRTKHTHVGVKPYKCFYCDFHSANSGNVNKHVLKKHPGMKYKWVKVGTFDTLKPHHDLKAKTGQFKALAIAPNQQYFKTSILKNEVKVKANTIQCILPMRTEMMQPAAEQTTDNEFYLMTQVENGVPVVKLITKQELDTINATQAEKGEELLHVESAQNVDDSTEQQIVMQYAAAENYGATEPLQSSQLAAQTVDAIQLSEQQLQALDDNKDDMQVIYVPQEMMGSTLVIEDGSGADVAQADHTFTTDAGQSFMLKTE